MGETGIGAAVRRKEDFRFITGKGQYTDDISRPGQTYIHFVRSPHAHAKIKKIDATAAKAHARRGRGADRRGPRRRQDRQSDLRLGDHLEGRHADEDVGASGDRQREGEPRRRCGRGGRRRDAGAGQGRGRETRDRLRGAARRRRSRQGAGGRRAADPRGRAEQHDLPVASRRPEGGRSRVHGRQPRHQARLHQQPPGAERDGAARRDRRLRCRQRRADAVEYDAEPACGAARHRGLRRHGAGAQAARDRAGCRRRLRLEDLHLSGRGRLPVGRAQGRPAGEMGFGPLRSLPHRRAWARPRHPCRDGVRRRGQDHGVAREDHRQSRRLHVDLLVVGADLSLCDAAVRPVRHREHLLRGRRGLYQHRAGRCLSRRRAAGSDLCGRAAGRGRRARARHRSGRPAQAQLHQDVPAPDAGDHGL